MVINFKAIANFWRFPGVDRVARSHVHFNRPIKTQDVKTLLIEIRGGGDVIMQDTKTLCEEGRCSPGAFIECVVGDPFRGSDLINGQVHGRNVMRQVITLNREHIECRFKTMIPADAQKSMGSACLFILLSCHLIELHQRLAVLSTVLSTVFVDIFLT